MNPLRALRAGALGALCLSCTDPRARPVPPIVQISFATTVQVTSPDTLDGSLYAFDEDGFILVRLRAATDDNSFNVDSTVSFDGFPEATRGIRLILPAGIPVGTRLTIAATVEDLAGFATTDSTVFLTENTP